MSADGQKKPAAHILWRSAELASAKQEPAEHILHAAAPTRLYVPAEQAIPTVVMAVAVDTVCDTLTVYVPAPPVVPAFRAVMVVPAAKLEPVTARITFAATENMGAELTVCAAPLTVYVPIPPWLDNVMVCDVTVIATLIVPVHVATQGFVESPVTVDTITPAPLPNISVIPLTRGPEVMAVTVRRVDDVTVPVTTALPSAVICVDAAVVPPVTNMPTEMVPEVMADTVSVFVVMEPVNAAATRVPTGEPTVSVLSTWVPVKVIAPVPTGQ